MIENEYRDRNVLLRKMGYYSYSNYLESDLWKSIRDRCFSENKNICMLCTREATTVHHLVYTERVMKGETIDGLVLLCGGCHYKVEFARVGQKRTIHDAREQYYKMRKRGKDTNKKYCPQCKQRREWGGCLLWCKQLSNPNYVATTKDEERLGIFRCDCGKKRSKERKLCNKCMIKKYGKNWKFHERRKRVKKYHEDKEMKQVREIAKWLEERKKVPDKRGEETNV